MITSAYIALAIGSGLLTFLVLYILWTWARNLRFQISILRLKRELEKSVKALDGQNDLEFKHHKNVLAGLAKNPYFASLPILIYLVAVYEASDEVDRPKTDRSDLRAIFDQIEKKTVHCYMCRVFLESPALLLLIAFLAAIPKFVWKSSRAKVEDRVSRSLDHIDCTTWNSPAVA